MYIALGALCGCSWNDIFPPNTPTLPNGVAIDRAVKLCALTHGDQPFHLILVISPPSRGPKTRLPDRLIPYPDMHAQIEIFWLNPMTYRTVVRAPQFTQIRIVNGSVVDERNTGDFYPRWVQNFVDALLDPIPHAASLRRQSGTVPVSQESHACIVTGDGTGGGPQDETEMARVCFEDKQPLLASAGDFTRSVSFDDFVPFGTQLIPRTLINDLPANFLLRGRIMLLEPLRSSDYSLLKAARFTPPAQQIRTQLMPSTAAVALLNPVSDSNPFRATQPARTQLVSFPAQASHALAADEHTTVYIRTDRTGRVREAYPDSADIYNLHQAAVAHALTLRFKPLLVNGVPQQMEAPLEIP